MTMATVTVADVTAAKTAFAQAIRNGRNGVAEHAAWQAARAAVMRQHDAEREQVRAEHDARVAEAFHLQRDADHLNTMAGKIGSDINTGTTYGGSRIYRRTEHEAAEAAWRERAAAHTGHPVPVVSASAIEIPPYLRGDQLPPMPDVPPVPPLTVAAQQAAADASA